MDALTTVFYAVWSQDPNRHEPLRGHAASIARQNTPVQSVHVFDDGDTPPAWLRGTIAVNETPLTNYQAWNVAVQLGSTD